MCSSQNIARNIVHTVCVKIGNRVKYAATKPKIHNKMLEHNYFQSVSAFP